MSKRQLLTLIGVWVMIFLFLGIPPLWHKILAVVTGLAVIAIAYSLPAPDSSAASRTRETFIENKE